MPKRRVIVLGAPFDLGASKAGASGGPAAIRRAGLIPALEGLGLNVEDQGDISVSNGVLGQESADSNIKSKVARKRALKLKNAAAILKTCRDLEKRVRRIVRSGNFPVTLGGDHSLAMGSVAGVAGAFRKKSSRVGLLWVDAHADINTPETSPSGNIHGMPVAHILGMGYAPFARLGGFSPKVESGNVCLIGTRTVDRSEADNLKKSGIKVFSMQDIDRLGMARVMEEALVIAMDQTGGFHLSFDIDAIDPIQAPGTGTTQRGGLTYRESHLIMEMAAESGKMVGLDMVEVNPLEDVQNATAVLAVDLIGSALGKKIY